MPDFWELRYGLDPLDAADASADPDADGQTSLQEFQANTHPRGFFTRFFAEGATSAFFDTSFATVNPGAPPAAVLFRCLRTDGAVITRFESVSGRRRSTFDAKALAGLTSAEFSTVVESTSRS